MNKFLKPKVILYIILGIIIGGVNKTAIYVRPAWAQSNVVRWRVK